MWIGRYSVRVTKLPSLSNTAVEAGRSRVLVGSLSGLQFLSRFGLNCFRFVHAEQPLLCFVDAGLAVVIAHLVFPSSLFGALMAAGLAVYR